MALLEQHGDSGRRLLFDEVAGQTGGQRAVHPTAACGKVEPSY